MIWTRSVSRRAVLGEVVGGALASLASIRPLDGAEPTVLEVGGGSLAVQLDSDEFDLSAKEILDYVALCARAVSTFMGKFPVPRAQVRITLAERARGVGGGKSWGEPEAKCRIAIGPHTTAEDLKRDWVLTHEMFHFAFPSVPDQNSWIEEGISTYAEPIARAHIGVITHEQVWGDMVRDMPKGLPGPGDQGLDVTHTWGRTYWGGTLFCLLADVGIRKATGNRRGLREALRAINSAGGNITVDWPLAHALEIGDRATGLTVLSDLHRSMGSSPYPVDLDVLWAQLGVVRDGAEISFDDRAPLAEVRKGIVGVAA